MPNFLDPHAKTITKIFKDNGYAVGHFGKWHLGHSSDAPLPTAYGIDVAKTNTSNSKDEFKLWYPTKRSKATKMVLDETTKFIEENKENPFYVNAWLVDPHAVLNPSEKQMKKYESMSPKPYAKKHLKRSLYEGGIRVPLLVRWPNHIPENSIDSISVVSSVDFIPTLTTLCGFSNDDKLKLDGEDMSSSWLASPKKRTKPLFWEWRFGIVGRPLDKSPMLAMRQDKWKLLMNPDRSRVELYDLINDPTELDNRALDEPQLVKEMSATLLSWKSHLPKGPVDKNAGTNMYHWPK